MTLKPGIEKEYSEYRAKNTDPYGNAVCEYTERWADLMEQSMKEEISIKDCFQSTSHKADTEGITGFMYGCAAQALTWYWIHGEEFKVAYNGSYGVGPEEKGVVNPAILIIKE